MFSFTIVDVILREYFRLAIYLTAALIVIIGAIWWNKEHLVFTLTYLYISVLWTILVPMWEKWTISTRFMFIWFLLALMSWYLISPEAAIPVLYDIRDWGPFIYSFWGCNFIHSAYLLFLFLHLLLWIYERMLEEPESGILLCISYWILYIIGNWYWIAHLF